MREQSAVWVDLVEEQAADDDDDDDDAASEADFNDCNCVDDVQLEGLQTQCILGLVMLCSTMSC